MSYLNCSECRGEHVPFGVTRIKEYLREVVHQFPELQRDAYQPHSYKVLPLKDLVLPGLKNILCLDEVLFILSYSGINALTEMTRLPVRVDVTPHRPGLVHTSRRRYDEYKDADSRQEA